MFDSLLYRAFVLHEKKGKGKPINHAVYCFLGHYCYERASELFKEDSSKDRLKRVIDATCAFVIRKLYNKYKSSPELFKKSIHWPTLLKTNVDQRKNLVKNEDLLNGHEKEFELSASSLYYLIVSLLLSVEEPNQLIFNGSKSIRLACGIVFYIKKELNERVNSNGCYSNEAALRNYKDALRSWGVVDEKGQFLSYGYRGAVELQPLFRLYPLNIIVDVFTEVVISKFKEDDFDKHLEYFLADRVKYCRPEVEETINAAIYRNGFHLLKSSIINDDAYDLIGSNSPTEALNRFTFCFGNFNSDLSRYIVQKITLNIVLRHKKYYKTKGVIYDTFSRKTGPIESIYKRFLNENHYFKAICEDAFYDDPMQELSMITQKVAARELLERSFEIQKDLKKNNEKLEETRRNNEKEIKSLVEDKKFYEELAVENENIANDALNERDKYYKENNKLSANLDYLNNKVVLSTNETVSFDPILIARYIASHEEPFDLLSAIQIVSFMGKGRVKFLPESLYSATAVNNKFRNVRRFIHLMSRFITSYYDELIVNGEMKAKEVFTNNEYALHESSFVKNSNSAELWGDRTVNYKNKTVTMSRHLKIGVAHNISQTIRIYFFFDKEEKVLVVGYCGEHPKNSKS